MTALEALSRCAKVLDYPARDRNGDPHWVEVRGGCPTLCSGAPTPFSAALEPYEFEPCEILSITVDE